MGKQKGKRNSKLSIAQLHWGFPPIIGGVETHLSTMLPEMVRRGHTVNLLTCSAEGSKAKEIYKDRCSTAEFPHAGYRNRGLQQLPVRGLEKVRTIAVWHALVHNFKMIICHGWLPKLAAR